MVSFEIFAKAMPPSLSELKVLPSFCFVFKIPDDGALTTDYVLELKSISLFYHFVIESEELIQEVNAVLLA